MAVPLKIKASPMDRPVRKIIKRYSMGDIVKSGTPVYVSSWYWDEQVSQLPNPPAPVSNTGEGHQQVPGRVLWWDGDNDVALIQYTAYTGTGHTGLYDGMDAEPFFDASRLEMSGGCVFVSSSAVDWVRSGLAEPEINLMYKADKQWPNAPMVCNLAQYRVPARVMGEQLGVTRQAIHLAMSKLPATIRELTAVLNRPDVFVGECQHPECKQPARSPRSKYCAAHWEDEKAMKIQAYNIGHPAPRAFKKRKRQRYALPDIEAVGTLDDFLPLVDQRGEDVAKEG